MRYFEVYFRINSSYQGYSGFESDKHKDDFYEEVTTVFTGDGWETIPSDFSGSCITVKKGKQELYLHPMNFSGVICEDSIDHLHSLLSAGTLKTFSCYYVDIYAEYKDMADDAYFALLHTQEKEMEAALVAVCRTKRRNLYAVGNMVEQVSAKFSVPRLGHRPGFDKERIVVHEVFDRLIRTGTIEVAQTKHGVGYRTTLKKENAA